MCSPARVKTHAVCKRLCKTPVLFYRCISRGSPEIAADKETVQWAAHKVIKWQLQDLKPGILDSPQFILGPYSSLLPTPPH